MIKKFLGRLRIGNYCPDCGSKMRVYGYNFKYECPHCDFLDRYDLSNYRERGD